MPIKHSHKINSNKNSTNPILLTLIYFISIVEPLATIPQIYTIWITKQIAGVSILSWSGFFIAAYVWLLYGFSRRDKALIISSIAWVVTEGLVILGLIINR